MGFFDRFVRTPSLDRFVATLIRAMRSAGSQDEFRYDRKAGSILQLRNGEIVGEINPGNMYRTYCDAPKAERPEHLKRFVRVAVATTRELPEEYDLAKPDLRPRLWTRSGIELQRYSKAGRGLNIAAVPVGSHLLASLVYDWPDCVQSVSPDNLERWDVTLYQALEDARSNLDTATEGYAQIGEGFYSFVAGDSYDATRLLLIDRVTSLQVSGRHVAMVPNRDCLLITGSEDPEGLEILATLAQSQMDQEYPLIGMPLALEDGEWVDWLPPKDNPVYPKFHEMYLRWISGEYAEQKEALKAEPVEEAFVASFSALQEKEGGVVSYSVWSDGVETLLPETDLVFLMRGAGPVATGEWNRVRELAGDWLEPTDHYPARWRTTGFPDEAVIEAIGQRGL